MLPEKNGGLDFSKPPPAKYKMGVGKVCPTAVFLFSAAGQIEYYNLQCITKDALTTFQ
ncbi:hypothetical protein [Enterococcus faecium]|uniref:hypothetical protein n=1 Tax=Enterococcus faecium TaxID=1352 RepID=UPI0013E2B06D|nr:hypothetical protein [Enterococcus faecium]MCH0208334.1 hypothetical protein [Enterococcus faecium]MCH0214165.1 hypothetical protein [Enterococcus faecium]MCH0217076.1 hypothetical protein [Enterococcus faecium]MCH0220125.1 hypothetical protein [Enterococcus faecium]MCH0223082.1 hypothetical protein [Enterococcus faecium]